MGLFSKKKKINVAVRTFNLLKAQPILIKDTILGAVLQGIPIGKALSKEMRMGFQFKAKQYYSYAAKYHPDGLPRAVYTNFDLKSDVVNRVIDIYIGSNPNRVLHAYSIEPANAYNMAIPHLVDAYNWNPVTNEIPDSPIKVDRAEFINNNESIRIYITGSSTPYIDTDIGYQVTEGELFLYAELTDSKLSRGRRTMFIYRLSTLLIPELYPSQVPSTPYFPITVLRHNKVNVDLNKNSNRYKRTVKLIEFLGLSLDDIMSGIMSKEEGNNPDNLDECFLCFSINLATSNKMALGYLAEYFAYLSNQGLTKEQFNDYLLNPYGEVPYTGIQLFEQDFNVSLSWNYIKVIAVEGIPSGDLKVKEASITKQALGEGSTSVGGDYNRSNLIFTYRNSKNSYLIVTVNGLEHGVDPYEGRYLVNSIDTLVNDVNAKDSIFIPINTEVLKRFTPFEQSTILMDSLNMVVYAVQISYLKWYERGKLLQIIGLVVTIVVAIFYPPAWSATAGIASAITAVVSQIIIQILIAQIIIKGAQFVGELVGGDVAQFIAVVAAITAIVISPTNIATAGELLYVVTGLNLATAKELRYKIKGLMDEADKFFDELNLKQDEIDKALSLLVQESTLDEVKKSIGLINQNETVEDYFNRTYYNTDTTELTFAMVNHRIDSLLQLPKPLIV